MDEEMDRDQAWLEANFPRLIKNTIVYHLPTYRFEIDTNEYEPGSYETLVFVQKKVGESWIDDPSHPYHHAGRRDHSNIDLTARLYHRKWALFLTRDDEPMPDYKQLY